MLSGEVANSNLIVFGLTRPEFESTIYGYRSEHPNNYATDMVSISFFPAHVLYEQSNCIDCLMFLLYTVTDRNI